MTRFRCLPVPTRTAERFRRTGYDDRGNVVRRMEAGGSAGAPCRVCLRYAPPGTPVLLGAYDLPGPRGIYWTPSPIFVHAEPCEPFAATGMLPETIAGNPLVSVRAYDADQQCLYDLGVVCPGADAEPPILRALADPRTSFLNVHTARPGCLLARVEAA